MTRKMIEVTTHDVTPTEGGLLHHSTCWCKQLDPDAVTITISREDAEHWAQHHPRAIGQYEQRIANAVRAALEGER